MKLSDNEDDEDMERLSEIDHQIHQSLEECHKNSDDMVLMGKDD